MAFLFSRVDLVQTNDAKRGSRPAVYIVPIVLLPALAFLALVFWAIYTRRHIAIREEWNEAHTGHHNQSFPQAVVSLPAVSLCQPSPPHFHAPPPPSQPPSTSMLLPPNFQDKNHTEPLKTIQPSSSRQSPSPISLASTHSLPGGDFDHPYYSPGRGYMSVTPSGQVVLSYLRNPDHLGAQEAHVVKSLQQEQDSSRSSTAHPHRNSDRISRPLPVRSSTLPAWPAVVSPPSAHTQDRRNRASRPLPIPGAAPHPSTSSLEEDRRAPGVVERDWRASTVYGYAI
jgi:hypothetical protein